MDTMPLLLSRIQFAFTISVNTILAAFTIGLAAWLTVLEALHLRTGRAVLLYLAVWYRVLRGKVGSLPDYH